MISKELLSEVLGVKINDIVSGATTPINLIEYEVNTGNFNHLGDDTAYRQLNIHELAHKCKEWAFKNSFDIFSSSFGSIEIWQKRKNDRDLLEWFKLEKEFESDTEPEAIFKACQWILDNRSK